jgi:alpha/beta superfamily hydrolase
MNAQTESGSPGRPAGAMQVLRDQPEGTPRGTAVIAHPHPLFGGTMDNKVVQTLARAFVQCGWTACASTSAASAPAKACYDEGRGERDLLARGAGAAPEGPLALAGFSFGAFVTAQALQALWASATCARWCWSAPRPRASRCRRCRPKATSARWSSTASQDDTVPLPPCSTGPGRSHCRLRWCPGSSISFTDNCRF